MRFRDRRDAGRALAASLTHRRDDDPVVLGLPRGGVPVAYEVAQALDAPLDVLVVRKLGVPWHPELGMGAVGEGGVRFVNRDVVRRAGIGEAELDDVTARERLEVELRANRFRCGRAGLPLQGRVVIIVDDGLATGGTAHAAVEVARARGAAEVVLAVPVAPPEAVDELTRTADEVVCLSAPPSFSAVGAWYRDFRQTTDEEVAELLGLGS
jgi:predicted phosphoribosyltransferase